MGEDDARKWDAIHGAGTHGSIGPAAVLAENAHLLPAAGRALDLACGQGANALFLAGRGLETRAWDVSAVAIEKVREAARAAELEIHAEQRDVVSAPPPPRSFDVIVVSYFLERALAPALSAALRPGGILFYQTYTRPAVREGGPRNPAFRLASNELLRLFPGLRVLVYREDGAAGDITRGLRDEALLVAQAPAGD